MFLMIAAASGLISDIRGAFFASGPVAPVIASAPHAAIGLVEAHGLAFILGVLLWRAGLARGHDAHLASRGGGDSRPARNRQSGFLAGVHSRRHARNRIHHDHAALDLCRTSTGGGPIRRLVPARPLLTQDTG
jgi:hypothetical protein